MKAMIEKFKTYYATANGKKTVIGLVVVIGAVIGYLIFKRGRKNSKWS